MSRICIAVALTTLCYGCGHTKVSRVGLLSVGDLESRTIPSTVDGPVLTGKDACKMGGIRRIRERFTWDVVMGKISGVMGI